MPSDSLTNARTRCTRVEEVTAADYRIPTDANNSGHVETDGTATWDATTLVVVHTRSGRIVGTGWTYGPAACADLVEEVLAHVVVGRDVEAISATWAAMVAAVRNVTRAGVAGYAISALDVALWDLKARRLGIAVEDVFFVFASAYYLGYIALDHSVELGENSPLALKPPTRRFGGGYERI